MLVAPPSITPSLSPGEGGQQGDCSICAFSLPHPDWASHPHIESFTLPQKATPYSHVSLETCPALSGDPRSNTCFLSSQMVPQSGSNFKDSAENPICHTPSSILLCSDPATVGFPSATCFSDQHLHLVTSRPPFTSETPNFHQCSSLIC